MFKIVDVPADVSHAAEDLKAAGVSTVIRYYNHQNSARLPSKRLEPAEAAALAAAGLSLVTVFQQRGGAGGNITDFGKENGKRDAARAVELAGKIGQPPKSAIYFAIDHDFYKAGDLDQIHSYFGSIRDVIGDKYRVGVYGSGSQASHLKRSGLVDLIWLAAAMGWSGTRDMLETSDWALYQKYPPIPWAGGAFIFDGNIVSPAFANDFGQFQLHDGAVIGPVLGRSFAMMEVIARGGLNLRRGPSLDYGIESTLPLGQILHVTGEEGEWRQVDLQGDGLADGYVHGQYLRPVSGGLPLRSSSLRTPYDVARTELALDVVEVEGPRHNPRIVLYHSSTRATAGTADETAWCSSFVNYCVEQAGLNGTNSQWALDWRGWGRDVSDSPMPGDIAVFTRKNATTNGGHVAFFEADQGNTVTVLGGNQSNRVRSSSYPKNGRMGSYDYKLVAIRRP